MGVGEILLHGTLGRARAIVVPLRTPSLPLARGQAFAGPAAEDEQVVFVCGPAWDHAQRQPLLGLIRFDALPASVVVAALGRAAGANPVVCPTVLFEDALSASPTASIDFLDHAPLASVSAPLAGIGADFAGESEPMLANTGTTACCLPSRTALPAVMRGTRFTTEVGQEAALFLSLRKAGLPARWAPVIRVLTPEENSLLAARPHR